MCLSDLVHQSTCILLVHVCKCVLLISFLTIQLPVITCIYSSDYDLFCGQHESVLLAIMYVTLCIIVWHALVVRHVGKPSGPFPSCFEAFRPALNLSDGLPSFKLVPNIYTSEYDLFCGQHECALLAIMYVTGCLACTCGFNVFPANKVFCMHIFM